MFRINSALKIRPSSFGWILVVVLAFSVCIVFGFELLGSKGILLAIIPFGLVLNFFTGSRPIIIIYLIVVSAALSTVFREFSFSMGNTQMTLAGVIWLGVIFLIFTYLLSRLSLIYLPVYSLFFIPFLLWSIFRWLLEPSGFSGLKDILWYSAPFVALLWGSNIFRGMGQRIAVQVETIFLISVILTAFLFMITLLSGAAVYTTRGPRGMYVGDSRALSDFLLIVQAIALSKMRYGTSKRWAGFFVFLTISVIFFTLGRTSILMSIIMFVVATLRYRRLLKMLAVAVGVGLVLFISLQIMPILEQKRIISDGSLVLTSENTGGRLTMWPMVFSSALENPVLGNGLGSARRVVAVLFPQKNVEEYFPHNEYLQVFHDLGLIGLFLFLLAWISLLWHYYISWRKFSNLRIMATWNMAAFLSALAIIIVSVVDNVYHYPLVVIPAGVVFGMAFAQGKEK